MCKNKYEKMFFKCGEWHLSARIISGTFFLLFCFTERYSAVNIICVIKIVMSCYIKDVKIDT